jgi:LPS-assembly lipoprotein
MSSFRTRRRIALFSLLALVACGYTPAFGPTGPARQLFNQVSVDAPNNRNQFDLVSQLEQRLGRADRSKYRLTYNISTRSEGVGVTPTQETFRFSVVGTARFELRDNTSNAVLTSGSVDGFTSYSVASVDVTATPPSTSAPIASLSALNDASRRLMVILADEIVTRLIAASGNWGG